MVLKEFIERFVEKNTLVRLWYKAPGGHDQVSYPVCMEWELVKSEYATRKVIGVTDILCPGSHIEAVNISIER